MRKTLASGKQTLSLKSLSCLRPRKLMKSFAVGGSRCCLILLINAGGIVVSFF